MPDMEEDEAFITECCAQLGDDPRSVKPCFQVTHWCVRRQDGRWRYVGRRAVDDREAGVLMKALGEESFETLQECNEQSCKASD